MPRDSEDWVHQLYVQHAPDLYRGAKYRLQDPELAYDLVQEVFLALLDHPGRGPWRTCCPGSCPPGTGRC